jgi:hypothetical protein
MELLPNDIFTYFLHFVDTLDYCVLLSTSQELHKKCLQHKKEKMPFIVLEDLYTFGPHVFSRECTDMFYREQFRMFNTTTKLSRDMDDHLHQLLFRIVLKLGLKESSSYKLPSRLYAVPWRFRKFITVEEHNDRYYMEIDTELYITSCLEKCEEIMKDTPCDKIREMESILFQKIMRKYRKPIHEFYAFTDILNKKFVK